MRKYTFTDETIQHEGKTLHRIQALISFDDVKAGDLGGFIEKKTNLSQEGTAWIYNDAKAYDDAWVTDNAKLYDHAEAKEHATISQNAKISGYSCAKGDIRITEDWSWANGNANAIIFLS